MRLQEKRAPQVVKSRHVITERIEVGVPTEEAFATWTEYGKWSRMFKSESADTGRKGRGRREEVKVRAKIGPSQRQWTAQVVDVAPGRRISWRSRGPLQAIGTTSFHSLDDRLARVMVEIEYQPTGLLETVGNFFRMQRRRVRRDLRLFKNYVELRGVAGYDKDKAADGGADDDRDGKEDA